jgi:hypothetical protein
LDEKKFPHLNPWIACNVKTKEVVEQLMKEGEITEENKREMTEKINVLHQIDNLMTYPYVKERVEKGELHLSAWHFAIETGAVEYYDKKIHGFKKFKKEKNEEIVKKTPEDVIQELSTQISLLRWTTVGLLGILGVVGFFGFQKFTKEK